VLGPVPAAQCSCSNLPTCAYRSQLVLGDRPIEITLERAWSALPWRSRLMLCSELVAAAMSSKAQVINIDKALSSEACQNTRRLSKAFIKGTFVITPVSLKGVRKDMALLGS